MDSDEHRNRKKIKLILFTTFFLVVITIGIYNHLKSLPPGLSYEGDIYYTDNVEFLKDLTYEKTNGEVTSEQGIFAEAFKMISEAKDIVVVDMFLFNDYTDQDRNFPDLSGKLTQALVKQKQRYPKLQVVFITDPINNGYHSYKEKHVQLLEDNDIEVVLTNLSKLRDSNKPYSSVWRLLFQPFGQKGTGWLPNPFAKEAPPFTIRSYLELFNVKANHRKVLITEKSALVTSANPHNESGFASNIGFKVSGEIISDMIEAEQAVIDYSGGKTQINIPEKKAAKKKEITVQYLTEGKILKHLVEEINDTKKGDIIWSGMFYIANRDVINAFHEASDRGVKINLILDPNKVAFGNQKTGLPNLPVASELVKDKGITIRWYESEQDQYHTKLLYIKRQEKSVIIGGSANHTTRNLDDLNLENDIAITAKPNTPIMKDVDNYFERLWNNENGLFTSAYEANEDALTPLLTFTYWLQKVSSLTTY
ncbi:HKD family nuclease [Lederbergia galactosidilyticus]|nr:HKD family nuclease [Lederbergia galactosidilytica]